MSSAFHHRSVLAAAVWLGAAPAAAAEPVRTAVGGAAGPPPPALEDRAARQPVPAEPPAAERAAQAGLLLPSVMAPKLHDGTAYATVRSGYDGATEAVLARAVAEASLARLLALRVEYEHGASPAAQDRVRLGARLALLHQADHGIDGGLTLIYDPKDFHEEGNIIAGLLVGRDVGGTSLFANALFGSDPEGDDQTVELRLGVLQRAARRVHVGLDARGRYDLTSDAKRNGTTTTDWEAWGLGTASLELGAFALTADAGVSARQTTSLFGEPGEATHTAAGVLGLLGAAAAF
jgi:hypothetical protein